MPFLQTPSHNLTISRIYKMYSTRPLLCLSPVSPGPVIPNDMDIVRTSYLMRIGEPCGERMRCRCVREIWGNEEEWGKQGLVAARSKGVCFGNQRLGILSKMDVFVGGRKGLVVVAWSWYLGFFVSWIFGGFIFRAWLAWLPRMAINLGMNMVGWKRDRLDDGLDDQLEEISEHLWSGLGEPAHGLDPWITGHRAVS